jgi:CheY-like chemotaxis protein
MNKVLHDITVLVAEDERPVRMLLRVVLESAGARVLEAEHGECALRLHELHPDIDVLCTDANMPIMDGDELVTTLRSRRPSLPVVACSAMDLDTSHPNLAIQADAVVQKPFVPSDLVRAICVALARREGLSIAAS